jgi:hypothetical protein
MEIQKPRLKVEFSLTVNLGNFNSAKLGGSLEDDIDDVTYIDRDFDVLYSKIRQKVLQELLKINKSIKISYVENPDGETPSSK